MLLFLPHVVDEDSEEVENVGLESGRCTDMEHRDEQREKLEEKGISRQSKHDYLVTNTTSTVYKLGITSLSASEAVQTFAMK